jgi:cytochrome c oxidase subunit 2
MSSSAAAGNRRTHALRIAALTVIATAIALPLVIFVLGPNMPPGKDTTAGVSQVFDNTVLLVVMTPFTMFILIFILYTVLAFRVRPGDDDQRDGAPIRGHLPSQIAWLATTTAAVLFLAIFGSAELLASNGSGGGEGPKPIAKPSGSAFQVQVIGQQWEFTYRYPSYGGVETAQLVLPVGQEIEFHVTSLDAVHSFWAYELGVKADANPGVDNVAFVKVKKPGTFQIRCAELCGLWHGYMFDTGRVVSQSQFASWIASQQKTFAGSQQYLPKYSLTYTPDPQDRAG